MIILRPNNYTEKVTYLVTGCARSGTSILAGTLANNGIYMGECKQDGKYEDESFREWFIKTKEKNESSVLNDFRNTIKNRKNKTWGFKAPNLPYFFHHIITDLTNPILLVSFRNPLDISISDSIHTKKEWSQEMLYGAFQHTELVYELLERYNKIPAALISFEKMLSDPDKELKELEEFIKHPIDIEKTKKYFSNGTYTHIIL